MRRVIAAFFLIAFSLAATARAQDADLVKKGQEVYTAQKCSLCHAIAGKGNAKGALDNVGGKWTADEIREWIVNWKAMAAKHDATRKPPMKDYSSLPKADVDGLVAYLSTLKQ